MDQNAIDEVLNRPLSQELLARDLARLAFIALDGTPRSIPDRNCLERHGNRHVHRDERAETPGIASPSRGRADD